MAILIEDGMRACLVVQNKTGTAKDGHNFPGTADRQLRQGLDLEGDSSSVAFLGERQ